MKPAATAAILAAIADLRGEVRQLRAELAEKRAAVTPRQARLQQRHEAIRELARAVGLGPTWPCAKAVLAIVDGNEPVPEGLGDLVARLRKDPEMPTAVKTVYSILAACDSVDSRPVAGVDAVTGRWPRSNHHGRNR